MADGNLRPRPSGTRVIGLTGGIASGKSTVARIFAELGATVIDADRLARDVVAPGQPAHAELVQHFGAGIVAADGTIDRKALAARVFTEPEARRTLNAITHPRIAQASAQAIAAARAAGAPLVIYEAALIVENGLHHGLDGLVVVALDPEVQVARLMARDGLDEAAARARLAAQLPLEAKRRAATHVIENDGDLAATRAQVEAVWREVLR
jgi:dephospho-CoA kinase